MTTAAPKNPKRKAYRNPLHPNYFHYRAYRDRIDARKRRRDGQRATIRRYHVPGEIGAGKYHPVPGGVVNTHKIGIKAAMMKIHAATSIKRAQ